jgi:hypothetical protein
MPAKQVLAEDWSEYDNKKKKGVDAHFFACTEAWEVDYLVKKIRNGHPEYSELSIRNAIASCCKSLGAPHPRDKFVECVFSKL